MSKQIRNRGPRRELLRQSLKQGRKGGFTTHGIKPMAERLGGKPTQCTLTGHCRTFLFEFPGSQLVVEEPAEHQIICSQTDLKAAVVSDLPAYFEKKPANSLHFNIDVSLRAAVHSTYEKALGQPGRTTGTLFLVVEQITEITPTELSSGQCFTIDETRDGEAIIEGGRERERALLAVRAVDCPWPDFHPDTGRVNIVLAAVKAVQDVTGRVRRLYECSCFVSSEGEAVYILNPTMTASGSTASRLTPGALEDKASRIRAMLENMMAESEPSAAELFDSVVLDETMDDDHLRLSYLRLWQALEDARRHLDQPGLLNERQVIAGNRAPSDLKEHRNDIAHWQTGRIDHSYLCDLQYTAMELLRRKYGGNARPRGQPTADKDSPVSCRRGSSDARGRR